MSYGLIIPWSITVSLPHFFPSASLFNPQSSTLHLLHPAALTIFFSYHMGTFRDLGTPILKPDGQLSGGVLIISSSTELLNCNYSCEVNDFWAPHAVPPPLWVSFPLSMLSCKHISPQWSWKEGGVARDAR